MKSGAGSVITLLMNTDGDRSGFCNSGYMPCKSYSGRLERPSALFHFPGICSIVKLKRDRNSDQ